MIGIPWRGVHSPVAIFGDYVREATSAGDGLVMERFLSKHDCDTIVADLEAADVP